MKKCLIWGLNVCFKDNIHLIQYYEKTEQIKIIGVTSNESYFNNVLGYPFINKNNIDIHTFDILIIMSKGKTLANIKMEAMQKGIAEEKIVPVSVMSLPGFDFDKYKLLKSNIPTIFAPCCWGGVAYSNLGLPFNSPFINMYELLPDYIKFLKNPKHYLTTPLIFEKMQYENNLKREFPVVKCDDITLYFNHYKSFEEAAECWNRRKERINWDNIIVMFFSDNKDYVNEFCQLQYKKKICFVPYKSENKELIFIDYKRNNSEIPFWKVVNGTANGIYFDIFELLLNNNVVPISEINNT